MKKILRICGTCSWVKLVVINAVNDKKVGQLEIFLDKVYLLLIKVTSLRVYDMENNRK